MDSCVTAASAISDGYKTAEQIFNIDFYDEPPKINKNIHSL